MNKIFIIWNRGYGRQMVIADDRDSALAISLSSGHIRRPSNYRRFLDATEDMLASGEYPGLPTALECGRSGVAILNDGQWEIDGKPVS